MRRLYFFPTFPRQVSLNGFLPVSSSSVHGVGERERLRTIENFSVVVPAITHAKKRIY